MQRLGLDLRQLERPQHLVLSVLDDAVGTAFRHLEESHGWAPIPEGGKRAGGEPKKKEINAATMTSTDLISPLTPTMAISSPSQGLDATSQGPAGETSLQGVEAKGPGGRTLKLAQSKITSKCNYLKDAGAAIFSSDDNIKELPVPLDPIGIINKRTQWPSGATEGLNSCAILRTGYTLLSSRRQPSQIKAQHLDDSPLVTPSASTYRSSVFNALYERDPAQFEHTPRGTLGFRSQLCRWGVLNSATPSLTSSLGGKELSQLLPQLDAEEYKKAPSSSDGPPMRHEGVGGQVQYVQSAPMAPSLGPEEKGSSKPKKVEESGLSKQDCDEALSTTGKDLSYLHSKK
ncbi:hypothetical protein NDU88_001757 [Pleurodeles waltl]|uniref:Uncharacterized protein n=1 Tax=Pleurodeles waltl TaxID=8319 RepID=A0AAV7Q829_PLEWA|nr:hypothetical protein NDU88_001757 [Pleurodeles waltl]